MFPNLSLHVSPLLLPEFFQSVHVPTLLCNSSHILVPKSSPKSSGFSPTKTNTHFKSWVFLNWFLWDVFLPSISCAKYTKSTQSCLLASLVDSKHCLMPQLSHPLFHLYQPDAPQLHHSLYSSWYDNEKSIVKPFVRETQLLFWPSLSNITTVLG